jgi:predicted nucleic acid-binding protein
VRIVVDTNVVLDVLLEREPFVNPSKQVLGLVEASHVEGYLCATTITTLDYLLCRSLPRKKARAVLGRLLGLFEVAPVNRPVIDCALKSVMTDFEDAVIDEAARLVDAPIVVTRNTKDFKKAHSTALDPVELLAQFSV